MQFCAMPELPPSGKLGTRILSHDTVESALIRRAGYEVWSDYDLGGSYEEGPPHLPVSLQRDRRWCQGNMQHAWFLFSRGLTMPSRVNILVGIMAYAGSPLWLLFLVFSPVLFIGGHAPVENMFMFAYAMFFLFVPKALGAMRLASMPEQRKAAGGVVKIFMSIIFETIYAMILAPILMLFYTQFVWSSYFGGSVGWGRQKRTDDAGPSWRECTVVHLTHTLLAIAVGVVIAWLIPTMLPWMLLVLVGPIVSIPFSRLMASNALGRSSRRHNWFLIPEETEPPAELQQMQEPFDSSVGHGVLAGADGEDVGLAETVLNPRLNAIHVSLLHERQQVSIRTHEYLMGLCDRLLRRGPLALSLQEKRILLWDADSMLALHRKFWSSSTAQWHPWWQGVFQRYVESLAMNGK